MAGGQTAFSRDGLFHCDFDTLHIERWGLCCHPLNVGRLVTRAEVRAWPLRPDSKWYSFHLVLSGKSLLEPRLCAVKELKQLHGESMFHPTAPPEIPADSNINGQSCEEMNLQTTPVPQPSNLPNSSPRYYGAEASCPIGPFQRPNQQNVLA